MPVTMRDVAKKAGVSIKTVSRAVNGEGEISEATRQRILAIIDELGYRPNRVARGLVTQRTLTAALVVGDITNPYFPEIARGAQDVAQVHGYNLFMCNTDGDLHQEQSVLQSLADHLVDGIIIYPTYDSQQNLLSFADYFKPLVAINLALEHPGVGQIFVDNYRGIKLAVDYLVGKGHTNIGMLTGVQNPSQDRVRRIQGFRDALKAHSLTAVAEWMIPCVEPTFEYGYESAKKLLQEHHQVTAIVTYNDLLALGAIRACHELGRRIPDDCAIIGFDNIQWAATSIPALTSVHIDKYGLGQQAMTRLLDMLNHPDRQFPPIRMGVELVVRESA